MSCPYVEGQTIVVQATFRDLDGVLADPDTVTVTVEDPDGVQSSPAASNVTVGVYQVPVTMDVSGWWKVRVVGVTGGMSAVCEILCCAKPSALSDVSPGSP